MNELLMLLTLWMSPRPEVSITAKGASYDFNSIAEASEWLETKATTRGYSLWIDSDTLTYIPAPFFKHRYWDEWFINTKDTLVIHRGFERLTSVTVVSIVSPLIKFDKGLDFSEQKKMFGWYMADSKLDGFPNVLLTCPSLNEIYFTLLDNVEIIEIATENNCLKGLEIYKCGDFRIDYLSRLKSLVSLDVKCNCK